MISCDSMNMTLSKISSPVDELNIFDKNLFKSSKQIEFGDEVKRILKSSIEQRTSEHIRLCIQVIKSRLESFKEYPFDLQKKICQCCYYENVSPKRIIIRENQKADRFYFIISGQAVVSKMVFNEQADLQNKVLAVLKEGTSFGV